MTNKQSGQIGNSFKDVIESFLNVGGDMLRKFPLTVVIFFGFLFLSIYSICESEAPTKLIVSILIGIFSVGVYLKNKNYSETILTLFLGLLTVFSIEWSKTNTLIFTGVLFSFSVIFFLISALRISSELETILTQAASFISVSQTSYYYKLLHDVATAKTRYNTLGIINRAKSVRFLVFMRVPIEQMKFAVSIIEMIKMVYQVSIDDSMKYYYSFYQIVTKNQDFVTYYDFDQFHERVNRLQVMPNEFLTIFDSTKYSMINGKLTIDEYFSYLSDSLSKGNSREMIIDSFKQI